MANSNFFYLPSFDSALNKSVNMRKLALRVNNNKKLLKKFEEDLKGFTIYKDELRRILDNAVLLRQELLYVDNTLKYIFGYYLPDVAIRILAKNLSLDDLPGEDKMSDFK